MDVWKIEEAQKKGATEETDRPPLAPSEKNNVFLSRKPRTREISSRFMLASATSLPTPSAPRRCSSPIVSRTVPSAAPKRSQSAERRRPISPSSPPLRPSLPSRPSSPKSRPFTPSGPSSPQCRPFTPSRPSSPQSRPFTPSRPSSPQSRPFTPSRPSSPQSRPSTPVQDTPAEMQLSSRRLIGSRMPEGLWPSTRSLSASFQSDTSSLPSIKREKPTLKSLANAIQRKSGSPVIQRKATPERKRTPLLGKNTSDQSENSKPVENLNARIVDQHLWPAKVTAKVFNNSLTRSVDFTDKTTTAAALSLSGHGVSPTRGAHVSDDIGRSLYHSTNKVACQASFDGSGRTEYDPGMIHLGTVDDTLPVPGLRKFVSSSASVSSSSGGTLSTSRPSRTQSLPLPGFQRPQSPNKAPLSLSSSTRNKPSPSRSRPSLSAVNNRSNNSSSILNFTADVRKGKKGASHIEDAHHLRLLYNRYLQWRFVNAQTDATLSIQKVTAENILYNVWNATSELRDSVTVKRINLQQLREEMKLRSILEEQITYLDDWTLVEREHSSSLSGATETLEACTYRVPVTGGARADIHTVKNVISSAVDVMQAMGSSICYLLSKVEGMNHLVSELAHVASEERIVLDECGDLLASTAAMQVEESSLRTHLIQLKQDMNNREKLISAIQVFV